jgi:hypothetical protein
VILNAINNESTTAGIGEVTRLTSAGGGTSAFAVLVKSNYSYNIYNVRLVEIIAEGHSPVEIGSELKAINLAEDFTQQGQLPAGGYVLVFTAGEKNVFYAKP